MNALIIQDMDEDHVRGANANPLAAGIISPISRLLAHAREEDWVIVFSGDAHQPDDPELKIWGEHAMAGTLSTRFIKELTPGDGAREIVSRKRCYGSFDGTGLHEELQALGVDRIILTGQETHICVRHSAYGALFYGYELIVPRDGVCAFESIDEDEALDYLREVYGARITTVDELVGANAETSAVA